MGQKSPEMETYYMGIQAFKIISQMDDLKFDDNFPVTGTTKIKKKRKRKKTMARNFADCIGMPHKSSVTYTSIS